jgi:AbrB family looped-hinge helix DNA binding protein
MDAIVTIDKTGRIVVPRKVRDELHLVAGTLLHIERFGDRLTLTPAMREARLTIENGTPVIIPADTGSQSVLTTEAVNEIIAKERNKRGRAALGRVHNEEAE